MRFGQAFRRGRREKFEREVERGRKSKRAVCMYMKEKEREMKREGVEGARKNESSSSEGNVKERRYVHGRKRKFKH